MFPDFEEVVAELEGEGEPLEEHNSSFDNNIGTSSLAVYDFQGGKAVKKSNSNKNRQNVITAAAQYILFEHEGDFGQKSLDWPEIPTTRLGDEAGNSIITEFKGDNPITINEYAQKYSSQAVEVDPDSIHRSFAYKLFLGDGDTAPGNTVLDNPEDISGSENLSAYPVDTEGAGNSLLGDVSEGSEFDYRISELIDVYRKRMEMADVELDVGKLLDYSSELSEVFFSEGVNDKAYESMIKDADVRDSGIKENALLLDSMAKSGYSFGSISDVKEFMNEEYECLI